MCVYYPELRIDKTRLYNFSKVKKDRRWLKVITLNKTSTVMFIQFCNHFSLAISAPLNSWVLYFLVWGMHTFEYSYLLLSGGALEWQLWLFMWWRWRGTFDRGRSSRDALVTQATKNFSTDVLPWQRCKLFLLTISFLNKSWQQ